ncbi:MAG: peptidoglycan DD-metalloendopeptidase family protein [Paracoccaceae bacterium]
MAAAAGTAVHAAADGTVAAITRATLTGADPGAVTDGLMTLLAPISTGSPSPKGVSVKRGQSIAKVRNSDPGFVHFEVRKGFDSVDPDALPAIRIGASAPALGPGVFSAR